jgi:hypothetical protein
VPAGHCSGENSACEVQAMTRQTHAERSRFWDGYVAAFPLPPLRFGNTFARWRDVPGTELVVSHYITNHSVGDFVRGVRGVPVRETAARLPRLTLELALGAPFGRPDFPFVSMLPANTRNPATWPRCQAWLHAAGERYVAVLAEIVGGAG